VICPTLEDFVAQLPPNRAIAGLDFGDKTTGIAIPDLRRRVATPTETIRRVKFTEDATRLLALLTTREVHGIVLGLPLNMDGSTGPRVQATQAFARNLTRMTALPTAFWDERLSTLAAHKGTARGGYVPQSVGKPSLPPPPPPLTRQSRPTA